VNQLHRYVEDEHGLRRTKELVVIVEGAEPFVFGMDDGQRHSWDPKVKDLGWWQGKGLGMLFEDAQSRRSMLRDPFRKRDFPAASLGDITYRGRLWVRPSRWLYAPSRARWFWLEPETMERTPVEWPEHSEPLVLFSDGRILIANATEGLQLVDPEHATAVTLDTHGVDVQYIYPNSNGMRVPFTNEAATEGSIVLQTNDRGWLVLDENATSVRRLPASEGVLVRMTGPNEAILQGWSDDGHLARISRIDLTTGALTPLWPPKASP
jgi:hypothetical protein